MRIKNIRCIFNLLGTVIYINNHSVNFNNYSCNYEASSTMGFAFYNKWLYSFDISNGNVYLIEVNKNNIISTNCGTTLMKFPLGENIFYNFKSEIVITNLDKSYHFFPYFASITNDYHEFILFNYLEKLPKWTLKYITGPGKNSFKGKMLSFESIPESPDGKIRYVDVLDESANPNIFYEFKSVKTLPPGKFKEQFLKDLNNATSLDQINWVFDATKNPGGDDSKFYEAMKDAIDKIPNSDLDLVSGKFINTPGATGLDLKKLIKETFLKTIFVKK